MEVATPAELVGAVTSVADTLGNLMTKMLDPGAGGNTGGNNTDNSTETGETDPCSMVPVIDKVIPNPLLYLSSIQEIVSVLFS